MVASNNAINDTVGAIVSGVTNTLTVTNLSNTASSAARTTIVVGGATAGDPALNFNITGVTQWEMGADNDDGDSFILAQSGALGMKNTFRMDTDGARTMPLQPAFIANRTSSTANATGDGTTFTVIFDSVVVDQASNYNNGTGIFTVPKDGLYIFHSNLNIQNLGGAHNFIRYSFNVNGADSGFIFEGNPGALGTNVTLSGSHWFSLSATDTVKVIIRVSGGAKTVTVGLGYFAGALLL